MKHVKERKYTHTGPIGKPAVRSNGCFYGFRAKPHHTGL